MAVELIFTNLPTVSLWGLFVFVLLLQHYPPSLPFFGTVLLLEVFFPKFNSAIKWSPGRSSFEKSHYSLA